MQTIIGAFDDRATAQTALERLVSAGFDRSDLHVEQRDTSASNDASSEDRDDSDKPGVISSFFSRLFGNDDSSDMSSHYGEAVRRGSSVVVVDAQDDSQAERAASILQEQGAYDIDDRAKAWRASGWTGGSMAGGTTDTGSVTSGKQGVLNVVQEELTVGKRALDRGGVRVFQRVTQQPVREIVRLREEHATIERRPVDRPATAEDLSSGLREGSIEVREMTEEPVVAKRARVVEEVRVGKEVRERDETIEDKVRRTDVDVERIESEEDERAYAADRKSRPTVADDDLGSPSSPSTPRSSKRTIKKDSPNS